MSCKKRKVDFSDSTTMAVEAAVNLLFRYLPEENRYNFLKSPEARGIIEGTLPTIFDPLPETLEEMGAHGQRRKMADSNTSRSMEQSSV